MTHSGTDLTAELHALPGANPPPCAVDLDVVHARGRALRRRRRAVGIGGGLAAAGLAAILIVTLIPGRSGLGSAPSPPAGHGPRSAGSDPFTSNVSFGWLPAGLHLSGGETGTIIASNGTTEFDASALKTGQQPPPGCGVSGVSGVSQRYTPPAGTPLSEGDQNPCYAPAADVDGHKAFWSIAPDGADGASRPNADGYVELIWEYAPKTWAYVEANVGKDTSEDIVGTVYKVAESLRIGAPEPVPLPFHLPSVPDGMQLEVVMWRDEPLSARGLQPGEDWIGASLSYGIPSPQANPPASIALQTTEATSAFPTTEELAADGGTVPAKDIRQLTVDGRQAIEFNVTTGQNGPFESLTVHDIGGADFTLTLLGTQAVKYGYAQGGIVAYFDSIHVFGGTDPNGWTTDVVG